MTPKIAALVLVGFLPPATAATALHAQTPAAVKPTGPSSAAAAVKTVHLADVRMRDACVLADSSTQTYYLVASAGGAAVRAYTSKDLVDWEGPQIMVWSSFGTGGYTTGAAVSDGGKLKGSWKQRAEPLFAADGGHPMIFNRFDGTLMLGLHQPNEATERVRLFELEDTGETLRIVRPF